MWAAARAELEQRAAAAAEEHAHALRHAEERHWDALGALRAELQAAEEQIRRLREQGDANAHAWRHEKEEMHAKIVEGEASVLRAGNAAQRLVYS